MHPSDATNEPEPALGLRGLSAVKEVPGVPGGVLRWAPHLDLRNCGPEMFRLAVLRLAHHTWPEWFATRLASEGVTYDDVGSACAEFLAGFRAYVETPGLELQAALQTSGFLGRPVSTQSLIGFAVGQIAVGMIGHGLKGSTFSEDDEYVKALKSLEEAGRDAFQDTGSSTGAFGQIFKGLLLLTPYRPSVFVHRESASFWSQILSWIWPTRMVGRSGVYLCVVCYDKQGLATKAAQPPEAVRARLEKSHWRFDAHELGGVGGWVYGPI